MRKYTLVDLFAGIGGVSLAGDHAGFETTAFCEIDPFCQSILKKHWPEVPIFHDVRTLDRASLVAHGIHSIDLLHASTPCQPFSVSGKRKGNEDERALWPNVLRVIRECRPRAVLIENVAGALSLAADTWLGDLEGNGYSAGTAILPAAAVGAPHKRDRLFILAYSAGTRRDAPSTQIGENIALELGQTTLSTWLSGEHLSPVGRVAHGLPSWIHGIEPNRVSEPLPDRGKRLRTLGNAVVPAQVWPVLTVIHAMLAAVDAAALAEVAA